MIKILVNFLATLGIIGIIGTIGLSPPMDVQAASSGKAAPPATKSGGLDVFTLQLKWYHQFQFAGYYAAKEKGFYKSAGLDVILREYQPGKNDVEQVLSGKARYGVSGSNLVLNRLMGDPVVVLATLFQHNPVVVISKKGSGITTPQDLAGKRLMWSKSVEWSIPAMFFYEGISLDDINIIKPSWKFEDLIDGKTDAVTSYITNQPFYLRERGVELNIIRPYKYGAHFYGDVLFTTEKELKEHPERARKFRQASLDGWEYAMANQEEMVDIIKSKYKSKRSVEHLRYEAEMMRELILPDLVEIGRSNPGRWNNIARIYVDLGEAREGYDLEGFLYEPDIDLKSVLLHKVTRIILTFSTVVFMVALALLYFNYRLKKAVSLRTEELMKSKMEAESSNRAKSEFLANMSHEIRTPMNVVLGMNRLALESASNPEQRRHLETARNSAEMLLTLINDILDFSKIEAGQIDLDMSLFQLDGVLDAVCRTFAVKAREKGLTLNYHIPGGMHTALVGDEHRLRQILFNLTGNAVKFTEKGAIDIEVEDASRDKKEMIVQFCVRDTGIGLPEEAREHIFEQFTQADSSVTRKFGGTGLGLAICKKLTELHGGSMWIESAPGKGSAFFFTARYTKGDPTPSPEGVPVSEDQIIPPLDILLAEDNPFNRDLARIVLEQKSHTVDEAENGIVVLEKLAEGSYDLILWMFRCQSWMESRPRN